MSFMDVQFAGCPHDECLECSFRCVSRDTALLPCGAHVDVMGEQLSECGFCKRLNQPATQDYQDFELSMLLEELGEGRIFGVETEEAEKEREEFLSGVETYINRMDRDAAEYTSLPPVRQQQIDGVTFTYFKPFARILPEEREDFMQFVKQIF